MILFHCILLVLGIAIWGEAAAIDVPLTVQETAGVDRQQWPVTAGVPLPRGSVKSVEKLQILDTQGRFVPARFSVASRWWEDGSIQWLHCDFATTVRANEKTTYFLREIVPLPEFPSPIGLIPRGKDFEVITGPLRLVLGGDSNQLLDQVWVDENWGYDFTERTKILESGNFNLVLTSAGQTYRTSSWIQNTVEVEEYNPLRAVLRISGSFGLAERKEQRLDYVSRLTFYGGKTYFKLELTLLNRPSNQIPREVPLDQLSLGIKMNLDLTQERFVFGGASSDHQGTFDFAPQASLIQESSERYVVVGIPDASGGERSSGWADLSDAELGLSVAVKWIWQLYPKAFEVRNDATFVLKLFPPQGSPPTLPSTGARTHEILFHFHGKRHFASGQVKRTLLGFQKPLYAVAPARWYCQDTQVFGCLSDGIPDSLKAEILPALSSFDALLVKSRDAFLAGRDRVHHVGDQDLDGYGIFRFANFFDTLKTQPILNRQGDLAHALYLHFFRTGDLKSLEFAEEVLAQAADFGMSAEGATSELAVGAMIQGLFDSFLLTGNRRHFEAARSMASPFLRDGPVSPESTADVGSRVLGMIRSYEVTGDYRWLNRSLSLLEVLYAWQDGDSDKLAQRAPGLALRWKESLRDSLGETAGECGVVWESMRRYQQFTNDKTIFGRMERSWGWLLRSTEWDANRKQLAKQPQLGMVLSPGLAALSEARGELKFRDQAKELFLAASKSDEIIDQAGMFGLYFTAGQQFLGYLVKEPQSSPKRDVSVLVAQ